MADVDVELLRGHFKKISSRTQTQLKSAEKTVPESIVSNGKKKIVTRRKELVFVAAKCEPRAVVDPNFCEQVKEMRKNLSSQDPLTIEPAVWGALSRNRSVFCISPNSNRRTASFVPLVADTLLKKMAQGGIEQRRDPMALIVVPYGKDVQRLTEMFLTYFGTSSVESPKIVEVVGFGHEKKTFIQLLNGCSLIIGTPPAVWRLLDAAQLGDLLSPCVEMSQLGLLVIDHLEILLEEFSHDLAKILKIFTMSLDMCQRSISVAAFGSRLTAKAEKFFRDFTAFDPVVILQPFMTTVSLFADSNVKVITCSHAQLDLELVKALEANKKKIVSRRAVVVCCTDDKSADHLMKLFRSKEIAYKFEFGQILSLKSGASEADVVDQYEKWITHSGHSGKVLIVVDKRLDDFTIYDAEVLIHYNLPNKSFNDNGVMDRRFSTLKGVFKAMVERKINTTLDPDGRPVVKAEFNKRLPRPEVIMFVTEKDPDIAEEILNFLTETRKLVPSSIVQMADARKTVLAAVKTNNQIQSDLCPYLKRLGYCPTHGAEGKVLLNLCNYRHDLSVNDKPFRWIPQSGEVSVMVSNCPEPNRYLGHMVKHFDYEGKLVEDFSSRTVELSRLLLEEWTPAEKESPVDLSVEEWGMTRLPDATKVHRFIVRSVSSADQSEQRTYLAEMVDLGTLLCLQSNQCRPLPKQLWATGDVCQFPPRCIEVILSNVKPLDNDRDWTSSVTNTVAEKMVGRTIRSGVTLALRGTIWTEKVVFTNEPDRPNVGKLLIAHKVATRNEGRLICSEKMRKQLKFGPPPPVAVRKVQVRKTEAPQPESKKVEIKPTQLTQENLSSKGSMEVYISAVDDNNLDFYVQKVSTCACLDQLVADMQQIMSNVGNDDPLWGELTPEEVHIGLMCAVQFDGQWIRGRIDSISSTDNSTGRQVDVFCVDYGDFCICDAQSLRRIDPAFVERLPFQAIKCRFHRWQKISVGFDGTLLKESGDLLWGLSRSAQLLPFTLRAEVVAKSKDDSGDCCYDVSLLHEGKDLLIEVLQALQAGNAEVTENLAVQLHLSLTSDRLDQSAIELLLDQLYSDSMVDTGEFIVICDVLSKALAGDHFDIVARRIWSETAPKAFQLGANPSGADGGNLSVKVAKAFTSLFLETVELLDASRNPWVKQIPMRNSLMSVLSGLFMAIYDEKLNDANAWEEVLGNVCDIITDSCDLSPELAAVWVEADRTAIDDMPTLEETFVVEDVMSKLCAVFVNWPSINLWIKAAGAIEILSRYDPWMMFIPVENQIVIPLLKILAFIGSINAAEPILKLLKAVLNHQQFTLNLDLTPFEMLKEMFNASSANLTNLLADAPIEDSNDIVAQLERCQDKVAAFCRKSSGRFEPKLEPPAIRRKQDANGSDEDDIDDVNSLSDQLILPQLIQRNTAYPIKCPTVLWSQTEYHLKLRVMVANVVFPRVIVTATAVAFGTFVNDQTFRFHLELLKEIVPDQYDISGLGGPSMVIRLCKLSSGLWKRVTKGRKNSFLKGDIDAVKVDDDVGDVEVLDSGALESESEEEQNDVASDTENDSDGSGVEG